MKTRTKFAALGVAGALLVPTAAASATTIRHHIARHHHRVHHHTVHHFTIHHHTTHHFTTPHNPTHHTTTHHNPKNPPKPVVVKNTHPFAVVSNVSDLNVTCAPGATMGTSPVRVAIKMTHHTNGVDPSQIGYTGGVSTSVLASLPGGSIDMKHFEHWYKLPKNFAFPCPSSDQPSADPMLTISAQPLLFTAPIGIDASVGITLHRTGSAS